jgi:hypothetical protein
LLTGAKFIVDSAQDQGEAFVGNLTLTVCVCVCVPATLVARETLTCAFVVCAGSHRARVRQGHAGGRSCPATARDSALLPPGGRALSNAPRFRRPGLIERCTRAYAQVELSYVQVSGVKLAVVGAAIVLLGIALACSADAWQRQPKVHHR